MAGFEGFISIFEDDAYDGTLHTEPQALFVDSESLTFDKAYEYRGQSVGPSRVGQTSHLVWKEKKPKGDFTFQFRSGDVLKVLMSHFQNGTQDGTRYSFYPRTNALDYNYRGTFPNHGYGSIVAQPYTVSVLKKMFDTTSNGGTNSFFFKNGICHKLKFGVRAGDDAKATPSFVFRNVDHGTAVSANPSSSAVGSYATNSAFQYWSATALLNGAAHELMGFSIESDQGVQEVSRVGRQDPELYQFAGYTCKGNMTFDLPYSAMADVGSMFGTQPFALVATLYNAAGDQVVFEMPKCVRLPFDYQFPDGEKPVVGNIPFQAFESNGTWPIRVTVDTSYPFSGELILDAILGARTVGAMDIYDAANGARTLSGFNTYIRA